MRKKISAICLVIVFACFGFSTSLSALNYGEGTYGTCQYSSCSISVSSTGSVVFPVINRTTQVAGRCSVASDMVEVTTLSSTGYTLSIASVDANTALEGAVNGGNIPVGSGSAGAPTALTFSSWGYRVDGGAFGSGPTTGLNNAGIPAWTFAGIPANTSPAYVTSSNAPANPATIPVWYGVCASMQLPGDVYGGEVVYSAVVN